MLPAIPEGARLERFLPDMADDGPGAALRRRAALASTLLAGLELERRQRGARARRSFPGFAHPFHRLRHHLTPDAHRTGSKAIRRG
jgi:hypothetical protein